jgi:HK97 family phage major capsid protein
MKNLLQHKYAPSVLFALGLVALMLWTSIAPPEVLAGLGMLPLAIGNTDMAGITALLENQGRAIEEFKGRYDNRVKTLETELENVIKKRNRPGMDLQDGNLSGRKGRPAGEWIDTKSGDRIPVLTHGQSLADLSDRKGDNAPDMGRLLRGICCGGTAADANELAEERKAMGISVDPSGGYTVGGIVADTWIDALRAEMVLSRAGALMLPMQAGEVSIARVTGDPACSWHAENADITAVEPTFGKLTLQAKTVVCLVKFSLELGQDAANIEQQLQRVISSAMAGAIDSAGLNGVSTNSAAAPGGIFNLADRNSVTSIGAPTSWDFVVDGMYELMLDNVPAENIGAFIAHPAVWKKMRKLKTGIASDNTPLMAPEEVAKLPKLWTTAAALTGGTTASGIIADWRDLIMGMRQQITVRVLSETFMGSNLQLAVLAYARVDFGAARAASFCTLEGITV